MVAPASETYEPLQIRYLSSACSETTLMQHTTTRMQDDSVADLLSSRGSDEYSIIGDMHERRCIQRPIPVTRSNRGAGCRSWGLRVMPLMAIVVVVVAVSCVSQVTAGVPMKRGQSRGAHSIVKDVSSIAEKNEEGQTEESQGAEAGGKEDGEKEGEGDEKTNDEGEGEEAEGEGEGEGEEGTEGEEEVKWTRTDVQVASMLMGACFMVMILFHVVNYPDDDIRFYAWNTISAVVSIFVAVLMFQFFNEFLLYQCEHFLPTKKSPSVALCVVQYIHLTVWACLLQLVCGYISGTIGEDQNIKPMEEQYWILSDHLRHDFEKKIHSSFVRRQEATKSYTSIGEIAVRKAFPEREKRSRQVKCWGTLFAHITGFASINSGGCMQHLEIFSSSPFMAMIPIVINQLYVNVLFYLFTVQRRRAEEQAKAEGRKGLRAKLFNEEVSEAEIDICCLGWSFLLIQAVRYMLVGEMPTMTGETREPSRTLIAIQFIIGVGFAVAAVAVILVKGMMKKKDEKKEEKEGENEEEEEEGMVARYVEIFIGGLSMCFAWSFLFGGRWLYSSIEVFEVSGCSMETVLGRVLLAAFICIFVLCFIFVLDQIDDAMKDDDNPGGNQIVKQIIMALAVLAGFSWEHAFDGGVEAIAAQTDFPLTVFSILSLSVFVVVVPAWRQYILQKYMILLTLRKEKPVKSKVFDNPEAEKLPPEKPEKPEKLP